MSVHMVLVRVGSSRSSSSDCGPGRTPFMARLLSRPSRRQPSSPRTTQTPADAEQVGVLEPARSVPEVPSSVPAGAHTALTPTGQRLVLAITALSAAHHVDHVLRGVTGWPLGGGLNPFTMSLLAYPAIACGLVLSRRGRAGPRFWAILAGGGAVFVLAVHVGPAAGDSVTSIPDQHSSPAADAAALVVLAAFLAALVAHCVHEVRRAMG